MHTFKCPFFLNKNTGRWHFNAIPFCPRTFPFSSLPLCLGLGWGSLMSQNFAFTDTVAVSAQYSGQYLLLGCERGRILMRHRAQAPNDDPMAANGRQWGPEGS
jgi:hypothetical protein